ncbi:hypothetical protein BGX21_000227 [Mortierella sp. AD011]|nr:hypothetical protein BGX20_010187 [Mortierella sp. AD010]KAF9388892.1 hypothetical protein BGX21_000227 [Mortierella sp. AD011]
MAKSKSKPTKAEKQQRKEFKSRNPWSDTSIFAISEEMIKNSPDAKPFEDMTYIILAIVSFFIWRLSVAVQAGHQGSIGVWTLFSFGSVAIINVWNFFLVMVFARRRGDLGILKVGESDILRFTAISGLFGAWAAILLLRYKGESKYFLLKIFGASVFNLFWVLFYVKYYL